MRRVGVGIIAAALVWGGLVAATGRARADDARPAPGKSGGWWDVWFGDKNARTANNPASAALTAAALPSAGAGAAAAGGSVEEAAVSASYVLQQAKAAYQQEKDAYLRRMQVCDRLREIATERGDTELERQADAMLDRAWAVFQQRIARLPQPAPSASKSEGQDSEGDLGQTSAAPPRGRPQGMGPSQLMGGDRP